MADRLVHIPRREYLRLLEAERRQVRTEAALASLLLAMKAALRMGDEEKEIRGIINRQEARREQT